MSGMGLTPRQAEYLAAIRRLTVNGVAPRRVDLERELGLRPRTVLDMKHRLIERGYLLPAPPSSIGVLTGAPLPTPSKRRIKRSLAAYMVARSPGSPASGVRLFFARNEAEEYAARRGWAVVPLFADPTAAMGAAKPRRRSAPVEPLEMRA